MSAYSLELAKRKLDEALEAESAILTGSKSYKTSGGRELTRENLGEIRKSIVFWEQKVTRLNGSRSRKSFGVIPRDL